MEILDNSILVVGNGESRTGINLKNFSIPIIGCNALHRDFIPTDLVCCDRRMADEAVNNSKLKFSKIYVRNSWYHYFRKIRKNKNIINLPNLPYTGTKKQDYPDQWGSGPYAILIAAQTKYQNIYMLGFDLYSYNSKVNNIYKNSNNYDSKDSKSVDPCFWIYQIEKIFQIYKNKNFILINSADWKMPVLWKKENVEYRNITEFCLDIK